MTPTRAPRRPRRLWPRPGARPEDRLWPIWRTAPLALAGVAWVMVWVVRAVRGDGFSVLPWPLPRLAALTDTKDVLQISAGVFALVAAVLTAVYAYRKQRLDEAAGVLAAAADRRADQVELSRRYEAASAQLGDATAAVRLAGAYAMARLGDDWPEQRQTCVDVLYAYLRMPPVAPRDEPTRRELQERDPRTAAAARQEDQVRDSVQRLLEAHLKYATRHAWRQCRIDLTDAHLHALDLRRARVDTGIILIRARHTGTAWFDAAEFGGDVRCDDASFGGDVRCDGVVFGGRARFDAVTFGADARFSGARFTGDALFGRATFGGYARFDTVTFGGHARFDKAAFGLDVWFSGARFRGGAWFGEAQFGGDAWFGMTAFGDYARFDKAGFAGHALFGEATFERDAGFVDATFGGKARFTGAVFSAAPSGLDPGHLTGAVVAGNIVTATADPPASGP